ncbi:DMSO/TMAO reductase YedYZ molybdopterin-dependent catalytic subunit [Nitrobacteraceae bacterium AZCC 1564]
MARAMLDPAGPFGRHPLQPHQLVDRVTRTEDTIVLCHFGVARIDPGDWSLSIDGLVRRPMRLTLSEIMRRPRADVTSIHQCCGSPLKPEVPTRRICNVVWSGTRLSELIAECEPDPGRVMCGRAGRTMVSFRARIATPSSRIFRWSG